MPQFLPLPGTCRCCGADAMDEAGEWTGPAGFCSQACVDQWRDDTAPPFTFDCEDDEE